MKGAGSILEINRLSKFFGGVTALNDVSFHVNRGTITAIIGPNGSGKTTLLNIISGLYRANAGEILFNGKNIYGIKPHQVCYLGITRTFQTLHLFQDMTALENMMVGYHSRTSSEFIACLAKTLKVRREEKEAHERAMEVLNFVHLGGRENQPTSSLPFDDQKRLELARAIISRPKMILLDEPVAGLNISETEKMGDTILKLKESGITILLVEHDMNLVMWISDIIMVLNYGEKIAQGLPEEIQKDESVIAAYLGGYRGIIDS